MLFEARVGARLLVCSMQQYAVAVYRLLFSASLQDQVLCLFGSVEIGSNSPQTLRWQSLQLTVRLIVCIALTDLLASSCGAGL